jgi:hypothetical protein
MIAARIACRLVRKLTKPAALWLTERAMRASAEEAHRLMSMRTDLASLEKNERKREVALAERRNAIRGW